MPTSTTVRRCAAGVYAAIGVCAAVAPELVPAVFGGTARSAESRTEVRAVYVGIPLAFARTLLRSTGPSSGGSLHTVRDASAGMAVARALGAVLERRLSLWPTAAFGALEVALAVATHLAGRAAAEDRPPA